MDGITFEVEENEKPTICFATMCKNEEHCIKDTLESVYKYIDTWVVHDTGSTDNTCQIVTDFFEEKGIEFSNGSLGSFQNGYHLAGSLPGYSSASSDNHLAIRGRKGYGSLPFGGGEYHFYSEHDSLDLFGLQKMKFSYFVFPKSVPEVR